MFDLYEDEGDVSVDEDARGAAKQRAGRGVDAWEIGGDEGGDEGRSEDMRGEQRRVRRGRVPCTQRRSRSR